MTVALRFAPSPTGLLHVGNARIALVNWLFARHAGGAFILRLDDTDRERSRPEYAAAVERDLAWLGLEWDRLERQSDRLARYEAAAARLREAGRLYPCYESEEELAGKRRAALGRGRPPLYDRAALALSAADRATLEAEGRRPHWRFRLEDGPIAWDDLVRGPARFEAANLGDPVLVRADARPLYTLTSVVDDIELAVTHVIRGEDHVANTATQMQIFAALGDAPGRVAFAHLPLLTDARGKGLAKRLGGLSLAKLREEGVEAMAILSLLAHLGTADAVEPCLALEDLAAGFDLARFGRAAPKFDRAELDRLNARLLHLTPFVAAAPRLAALGLADADEAFWEAVRPNLARLADAVGWWRVCRGDIDPVIEDPDFAAAAAALLPPEPWNGDTWKTWTGAVAEQTGRKGKTLFRPLRLALTGLDHGPELRALLPHIGRARARARLGGKPD